MMLRYFIAYLWLYVSQVEKKMSEGWVDTRSME